MAKKTKKSFVELQNKWYKKLRDSGFNDLEWLDPKTGRGQNSYLKRNTRPLKTVLFSEENLASGTFASTKTFNFYNKLRHFINDFKDLDEFDTFILYHFSEGETYRKISKLCKKHLKHSTRKFSTYWVYYNIKKLLLKFKEWDIQQNLAAEPQRLEESSKSIESMDSEDV